MALWVLAMWFAPEAAMSSYGWKLTPELKTLLQGMGFAFATVVAQCAGENLHKFGMLAQLYQL